MSANKPKINHVTFNVRPGSTVNISASKLENQSLQKNYSKHGSYMGFITTQDASQLTEPYVFRGDLNDDDLREWLKGIANSLGDKAIQTQTMQDLTTEYKKKMALCHDAIKSSEEIISKRVYRKAQHPIPDHQL